MARKEFEEWMKKNFPNSQGNWVQTSEHTIEYNCVAWVLGSNNKWWQPLTLGGDWPSDISESYNVNSYIELFIKFGFEKCVDYEFESEYDKIAIFQNTENNEFSHVSKLIEPGIWSSKMGDYEDIRHNIKALENSVYGSIHCYMKRKI